MDGLGNLLYFLLSGGNHNNIYMAKAWLELFDLSGKWILADKGYDNKRLICWGEERGRMVVIASRVNTKWSKDTD